MRLLLAGACSLMLLTACSGGRADGAGASAPRAVTAGITDVAALDEPTARCTSPAGFSVDHPADWSVNSGDVLPVCSWFAAEAFAVPEASDVRTADITLSVRSGSDASSVWPDETARTSVEVAGRTAVRVVQVAGPGFYPEGTPITTYVVELGDGRTLVADTVGLPGSDYDRNVEVLDAMMASLVLDGAGRA
jgi:hypothetical protein